MGALLALLLSQCATGITDNAQSLCGQKAFTGLVDLQGALVLRGVTYSLAPSGGLFIASDYNLSWTFLGNKTNGDQGAELTVSAQNFRETGDMLAAYGANGLATFRNDVKGNIYPGCWQPTDGGSTTCGALVCIGGSGSACIRAVAGGYVAIASDPPPHYQGEHGALTVSATRPCENEGFNLIQASDGMSGAAGARTDYTINFTCLGGRYSRRPPASAGLPLCNNALGEPPEPNNRYMGCPDLITPHQCNFGQCGAQVDGGYCYDWTTYYGPDGGYAKNGTIFDFVVDVGEGCQCVSTKYDGGVSPAGWFKLSDRTECRP